jgi:DNA-binding transcriptional LysR family regulator
MNIPSFDLWQLEIFVKTVEYKSFSKAAEAAYISQPTVSNHISQLEKSFNTKLFDRLGRQVLPTKAGVLLYQHAKKMLELKQETIEALYDFLGMMEGELYFGASSTPGTYLLPKFLGNFKKAFPHIQLKITLGDSQHILDQVLSGELELGLVGSRSSETLIEYREIADDELILVVPSHHPWVSQGKIRLADLQKESFLIREVGSGTREHIENVLKEKGYKLFLDFQTLTLESTEAIKQAVFHGLGVAILPQMATQLEIEHGYLVPIPIEDIHFFRKFYYIYHTPRSLSPVCQTMIQFLEKNYGNGL